MKINDTLIIIIYRAIEDGYLDILRIDRTTPSQQKRYTGRGRPAFQSAYIPNPKLMEEEAYSSSRHPLARIANSTLRISRQLAAIACNTYAAPKHRNPEALAQTCKVLSSTFASLMSTSDPLETQDRETLQRAHQDNWDIKHYPALKLAANRAQELAHKHRQWSPLGPEWFAVWFVCCTKAFLVKTPSDAFIAPFVCYARRPEGRASRSDLLSGLAVDEDI